ncbi:hypothetical protein DSM112329_01111 [Paraconexibacter sp. AEG42_29]|uniref:Uncharacterized protein n=1 Tax=Paraconexibacter sp. AEG42_29 TaxID=2997339 RepID=A0AAU7ARN8_9ACTN
MSVLAQVDGLVQATYERTFGPGFQVLSVLRGDRSVHPQGLLCEGTLEIDRDSEHVAGAEVFRPAGPRPVIVRCSRMVGLPRQLGDVFGIAVRVVDAYGPGRHQDLLCNSSRRPAPLNELFLPSPRWYANAYSSCLTFDAGAGPIIFGWEPPAVTGPGPGIEALRAEVADRGAVFGVSVAQRLHRPAIIGTLTLRKPLPADADLNFDPITNTGGGLRPAGALNMARSAVYRYSRRGRSAATTA